MSYQVLALKYRPQSFDDVIGQDHVTLTLKNAITSSRVPHAVLFTGPRGTGKTTIARILAKAMNCETGPGPVPCNTCGICRGITSGHSADVYEIDGASNNSVDQVRELRENVTYMPASARYKIYIIDEVHMLSTAAFNALLKTLEEPPDHVMFIFATTEVHKIPATILSRCQRHDLGRVRFDRISGHLMDLSRKEGFTLSKESCDIIAIQADGSIRDSLSLLDRILSISRTPEIDHRDVLDNLGIIDHQVMMDISRAVFASDGSRLIDILAVLDDSGLDMKRFYSHIITHFRNLTILRVCGASTRAVALSEQMKQDGCDLTAGLSPAYLNGLLQVLLAEAALITHAAHTRTAIEMVLLKLLTLNPGAQLDTIIRNLDRLSAGIAGQMSPCPYADQPGGPSLGPAPASRPPEPGNAPADRPADQAGSPPDIGAPAKRPMEPVRETQGIQEVREDRAAPVSDVTPEAWQNFVKSLETDMPFISALLSKAQAADTGGPEIIVNLPQCSSFDENRLEMKNRELTSRCRQFFNKSLIVNIPENTGPEDNGSQNRRMEAKKRQEAVSHPFVAKITETFDGKIVDIT